MSGDTTAPAELDALRRSVEQLGYRAQLADGHVVSSASGMRLTISLYPGSLQIAGGVGDVPAEFGPEQVNAFNAKYRFGTLYSSETSVVLQANFLFEPDEADADARLEKILSIYEGLASALRDSIARRLDETGPEASRSDEGVQA